MVGAGKTVVGAGAAAVLLATIVYQGGLIAKERKQITALREGGGNELAPIVSAISKRDLLVDVSYRGADDVDLARLAEDLYRGMYLYDTGGQLRAMAALESIARLPVGELRKLFEASAESNFTRQRRKQLLVNLGPLIGEHDPGWLLNYCFPASGENRERLWLSNEVVPWPSSVFGPAVTTWAEREPGAALEWVKQALDENRFGSPTDGANEASLADMTVGAGAAAWSSDRAKVEEMLIKLPRGCRTKAVEGLISQLEAEEDLANLAESSLIVRERRKENGLLGAIGAKLGEREWGEVEAFAARLEAPHVRREVLLGAASSRWRSDEAVGRKIEDMLKWIDENVAPADGHHLRGSLLGRLDYLESDEVTEALSRFTSDPDHGQIVLGAYFAHAVGPGNPVDLLRRGVAELHDPEQRVELGYRVAVYIDERSFRDQELRGVGFADSEIEAIRRRFMR